MWRVQGGVDLNSFLMRAAPEPGKAKTPLTGGIVMRGSGCYHPCKRLFLEVITCRIEMETALYGFLRD